MTPDEVYGMFPHGRGLAPRVRLSHYRVHHVRMAEVLRAVVAAGYIGVVVTTDQFCWEMARRGVLDPLRHLGKNGRPVAQGIARISGVVAGLVDLGLVDRRKPPDRRYRVVVATRDGAETIADWDDPKADCLV